MTRIVHYSLLNDVLTAREHYNNWKVLISRYERVKEKRIARGILREMEGERGIVREIEKDSERNEERERE